MATPVVLKNSKNIGRNNDEHLNSACRSRMSKLLLEMSFALVFAIKVTSAKGRSKQKQNGKIGLFNRAQVSYLFECEAYKLWVLKRGNQNQHWESRQVLSNHLE
jgi:hypothetical protein